jgi:hypothetical protein
MVTGGNGWPLTPDQQVRCNASLSTGSSHSSSVRALQAATCHLVQRAALVNDKLLNMVSCVWLSTWICCMSVIL